MRTKKTVFRSDPISVSRKELLFALACAALILTKHMLASQLPISPRPNYRSDDHLMVMMARNILKGKWLGGYSYGTLMKGCFYPLFLTGAYLSGVSYLSVLDLFNSAAALYFTLQLRPLLHRRRWMLILFTALLFNPVNAAEWTFERVYRCSLTNMQTLFLFGSVIGAYLDQRDRFGRQLLRAAFCGFVLWSAWNTREDTIWMLPFVLTAGIVMLVLRLKKQRNRAGILCAAVLFLTPFALLIGGNEIIRAINYRVYGLPVRNEASAGFGKMIKTIYAIKNQEEIEFVSVSAEKLERMFAASPTLRLIEPDLRLSVEQADKNSDRIQGDGEVEDGWFYWCVRRAVESSGIAPTLPEADAFYRQVNRELEEAIRDPNGPFETQWVMPSALMSPWRAGYLKKIAEYTFNAVNYMVQYDELTAMPRIMNANEERMSYLFEGITGNASLHKEEGFVQDYRLLFVNRANAVISAYQFINPAVAILSAFLFLGQTIRIFTRKIWKEIPWLLITAGIGLSVTVLLLGIAYTDMTSFIAIRYTYISGGYALMLAFEWIVILRVADRLCERKKRKGSNERTDN